jgi:hypothetical protein
MSIRSRGLVAIGLGFVFCSSISTTVAGAKTKAAREAAEYIMKKFSKEAVKEGEAGIATRLERLATKYGDGVFEASRKSGPRGIHVLEELGEDDAAPAAKILGRYGETAVELAKQPRSVKLATRFGDDAAEALIRHPGAAEPVIEAFGKPAATAIKGLNGQNARRLAMMVDDGSLAKIPQKDDLLGVIGKYGDRGMDFVWRHKGPFVMGTVASSFWRNPEPYINGAVDLTKDLLTKTVPALTKPFAEEGAKHFPWTAVYVVLGVMALGGLSWAMLSPPGRMLRRTIGKGLHAVSRSRGGNSVDQHPTPNDVTARP